MDNLSDFYKTYGESLASRLAAIGHAPNGQQAFVFVEDIDDPKEVLSFTGNGKAPAGGVVLVWDSFDEDIDTAGRDNYHLAIRGTFSIIQKAVDQAAKAPVYRDCRAILLKAIALMIQDSERGILQEEFIQVDVRKFPLEKVGPVSTTWFGYGVEFRWDVPLDLTLLEGDVLPAS